MTDTGPQPPAPDDEPPIQPASQPPIPPGQPLSQPPIQAWQPPAQPWQPPQPQGYPAAGPVPYPPGWAPPPKRSTKLPWIIALAVGLPVLLLGGVCVWGVSKVGHAARRQAAIAPDRVVPPPVFDDPSLGPLADPSPEPTVASGPRASTYPVREDDDLNRVCDGWYYPTAPKLAGKAPHQITVGVISTVAMPSRITKSSVSVPELKESIWRAWMPTDPTKSQLMGCVDLERTGGQLKKCKFDDPKPEVIAMKQGFYHVHLYEVATGKKLLDKKVAAEDEDCPPLVFLVGDKNIYSEVGDRQLYELFRPYVMRK